MAVAIGLDTYLCHRIDRGRADDNDDYGGHVANDDDDEDDNTIDMRPTMYPPLCIAVPNRNRSTEKILWE